MSPGLLATAALPTLLPPASLPSRWVELGQAVEERFVLAPDGVPLLLAPYEAFDTAVLWLRFGQLVLVRRELGEYVEVLVGTTSGFVRADALTATKELVWPRWVSGEVYGATHRVTAVVRQHLHDMFGAGHLEWPLQAGEYITMRLLQDNLTLPWPAVRPRWPGHWHRLLRGVPGVRSGVAPQTDSVMEWTADDASGRLAYVEAVLPDGTVRVSGVGMAVAGEYSMLVLQAAVWREWRPVFITLE